MLDRMAIVIVTADYGTRLGPNAGPALVSSDDMSSPSGLRLPIN
jgi:hypothetical protein